MRWQQYEDVWISPRLRFGVVTLNLMRSGIACFGRRTR